MSENKITRSQFDLEMEAIDLGLHALAYMLRNQHLLGLDTVAIVNHGGPHVGIVEHLPAENLSVLTHARKQIADLMEWVGDYRNNTDATTEIEPEVTKCAFEAMHKFEVQPPSQGDPAPAEPGSGEAGT